jgi:multidrug transporter EmrE-like cation transporter
MPQKPSNESLRKSEEVLIDGTLQRGKIKAKIMAKWSNLSEQKICLVLLFFMLLMNLLVILISVAVSRKDVPSAAYSIVYAVLGFIVCASVSYVFVRLAQKIVAIGLPNSEDKQGAS